MLEKFANLASRFSQTTAILAGASLVFAFAPFQAWYLGICSLTIFVWLLHTNTSKGKTRLGLLYGLAFFLCSSSWVYVSINSYGDAPPWLAAGFTLLFCLYLACYPALAAYSYHRFNQQTPLLLKPILFASIWTLLEWIRGWFLSGFPWVFVGYAGLDSPLSGFVPVLGVYGLSFVICLIAATLAVLLTCSRKQGIYSAASILTLFVVAQVLGQFSWTQENHLKKSIVIVQGNIPQNEKWSLENENRIVSKYINLSKSALKNRILFWPEAAITRPVPYANDLLEYLGAWLAQNNSQLITGIPVLAQENQFYNSILTIESNQHQFYKKTQLVPFGEYVPFEFLLRGLIDFFDLPMSSFKAATDTSALLTVQGMQFKPAICYEIAYPSFVLDGTSQADALLTVSNDTWFGHSLGPKQHFQIARMRAAETGRALMRATNNGISGFIDAKGQVTDLAPSFTATTLTGEIVGRDGRTPLMIVGHHSILGFIAVLGAIVFLIGRRQAEAAIGSSSK